MMAVIHAGQPAFAIKQGSAPPAPAGLRRILVAFLNLLASIQVVWFYVNRVPPHIKLYAYEQGQERVPFQYRVLMMYPMRWAHTSSLINRIAAMLNAMPGWFPNGVRAEGIVQAPIDLLSVVIAGVIARRLYQAASRTGLLTPLVYPLTLIMIAVSYCLLTMHLLRFIYDLPGVAFFSLGLYFIYFRRDALFCLLFVVATFNRETTLMLLVFFAIAHCLLQDRILWRRLLTARALCVLIPLSAFWLSWHLYVVHLYAENPSESLSRLYLNAGILLLPITWPQIFGVFGYLWPFVLVYRKRISDPLLRAWLWGAGAWLVFMFYFGIFLETRIFGELIPYFAAMSVLIAEERLLDRIEGRGELPDREGSDCGHAGGCNQPLGVEWAISSSSGVMSIETSANNGVLR